MNESVSATPPTKLDIKTDNVYTTDGTTQHMRTITTTGNNATIVNTSRTPTDARLYHSSMIRTTSVDNANNASKSMTIVVQNPFEDSVRHVEDPSNDPSNATKYLLHSPSPSKQHSISNVQSPRTISRTPTPGTPHQPPDDVSMSSPSMPTNLQRHPSQQSRPPPPPPPPSSQSSNNGTLTNISTARNIVPQQQAQSVQHHVRFNQDLLHNYGINIPMTRQTSQPGTIETPQSPSNPPSVTSLIPLPSPLPNNLGVNMHHMNQPSITPTILGGFPIHQSTSQPTPTNNNYISSQQTNVQNNNLHTILPHGSHHSLSTPTHHTPTGIYVNTRPMLASSVTTVTGIGKVKQQQQQQPPPPQQQQQQSIRPNIPTNGTPTGPSAVVLRYPPMIQTSQQVQQHNYQMMKPRMMPPNTFGPRGAAQPPPQIIMQPTTMQQQTPIIYDHNTLYRTSGQQPAQVQQIQQIQQIQQVQQAQQQPITSLQSNPHMNDSLINQQKHQHQQSMPQQVLHLAPGMLTTDDNILKSLLQINPQANSEEIAAAALKARNINPMSNGISTDNNDPYDNPQINIHDNTSHNYPNSHHHLYNASLNTQSHPNPSTSTIPNVKIPKSRKKRKPNELSTSFEDDVPTKVRKRKKKGTEETEKFVEHSLQQLRDLPMLTPLEPSIDINNELSLPLPFNLPDKKYQYQGEFGHVFIENINDYYRPHRRPPIKPISSIIPTNPLSALERRYRICSTLLDHPPSLPSPPLAIDSNDKLSDLLIKDENNDIRDDESIISTSTLADDENMQTDNLQLLKTLSSNNDLRSLSPVLISNDITTSKNSESSSSSSSEIPTIDIKKETNDNITTPGGNELDKKDRPLVEGTDKVSVTLTLTTEAANNVQSVIAAVADLLKIAYPSTFDVHQTLNNNNPNNSNVHYSSSFDPNCSCSTTLNNPNTNSNNFLLSSTVSQMSTISRGLSTYKIGRETSVSIQSLIEMQPKYCRNCTQRLTSENLFKKRLTELPSAIRELIPNSEPFVYFCNEQCFNTCLSNTHNQQQTLTINTSINQSPTLKNEPMDTTSPPCTPNDLNGSPNGRPRRLSVKRRQDNLNKSNGDKRWKDIRWKRWDPSVTLKTVIRPSNTNEIEQLISDMKIPLSPNAKQDKRVCAFCNGIGDMATNGPGRLLNLDVGQWCHLNCALWSTEVYETVSGALMSVEIAYKRSINTECASCKQKGGSLTCFSQRCPNTYHFPCAVNSGCVFYKNKTIMCPIHATRTTAIDQILEDKSVFRKVWINRDEVKQIQNYMTEEHEETSYTLRIGSLVLHNVGQLLPHQLQSAVFHNRNFIYPVGYTVTRFYWSMRRPNRRCAYHCSIIDIDNKPMFRIRIVENPDEPAQEFLEPTAKAVWHKIVDEIDLLRRKHGLVKMFSVFVSGEDLYGLTEPHIIRLIESLPGVEMLQNYAFKYGRLQLLDMPLTLNPTGCARSEPKLQTHFRRHAQTLTSSHSTRSALPRTVLGVEGTQIPYVKHFVLSKSTQYRKLKTEWRQNVFLAKSRIQGLGLFAGRDLEKHTMVIEYIGELIRNEVANKREKLYEQQNRGIYMFRLDEEYVVDATMSGCLARYINHSCEPNSIAEVVQIEKDSKIIIITNRRIAKGEEIMYDYKFDFEEDSKIPCLCGAANCRKWMN